MRVLIVNASPLDNVIHALPVLDFLHQVSPGVEVDWVIEEQFADILADHHLVRQLFTVDTVKWQKRLFLPATWKEISTLKAALAARRYNIAFDLQGDVKSGLILKSTGCNRRYGFGADAVKEAANLRFTTNKVPLRKQDRHVTDRLLRLVSVPFGRDYSGMQLSPDVIINADDDQAAELFLSTLLDGLVILFLPGAPAETMKWSEKGWIELGKELTGIYPDATIVISWNGEIERLSAETIAKGVGRHVKLLQQSSLMGFTAIIRKVDLVIGGDVAPVHLAAAVGTPTVSFYRATDGSRNGPRGESHRTLHTPLPCSKCLTRECSRDESCRDSIQVSDMLTAARELLS